jgi:hypothetical protein
MMLRFDIDPVSGNSNEDCDGHHNH